MDPHGHDLGAELLYGVDRITDLPALRRAECQDDGLSPLAQRISSQQDRLPVQTHQYPQTVMTGY
jgi:hypothetical protein